MYLHPLLANVSRDEREALVKVTELRSCRRNEVLLQAEEWTDHIYCVASGLVRVVVHSSGDSSDATTDFIRQDDFFLGPTLTESRYQSDATLIAALPSSVYLVPLATVRSLCARHPEVAVGLLELVMKRMSGIRKQLRRISSLSSERLIGRVLHDLTQIAPAGASGYDKRITQSVIASYSGLSREKVNKIIRDMEGRGLIQKDDESVQVPPSFASSDFQSPLSIEHNILESEPHLTGPDFFSRLLKEPDSKDGEEPPRGRRSG